MAITLPETYAWNLLISVLIGFHCFFVGVGIRNVRIKYFNRKFFAKHFPEFKDPPRGGYPDMGNGKFAQMLSVDQWTDFNNVVRVHYNYLEGLTLIVTLELVAGLFFSSSAFVLGIVYIIGRVIYGHMYASYGASYRRIGFFVFTLSALGLLILSIYGTFQAGGGVSGLLSILKLK